MGLIRAAYLNGAHCIRVQHIQQPDCPRNCVLIRVAYTGICGSDLLQFNNQRQQSTHPIGHEFSGVIVAVGSDVKEFKSGDRVCVEAVTGCSECTWCLSGRTNLCEARSFLPSLGPSGLSEIAVVPATCVHLLPISMDLKVAALVEPLAVGLHALRVGGVQKDEHILVVGAGTIGLATTMVCAALGLSNVDIVYRHPHQAIAAQQLSIAQVHEDDSLDCGGYDLVINTVPGSKAMQQAIASCKVGGRVVLCGGFSTTESYALRRVVSSELTLMGSICYTQAEFAEILHLVGNRSISPEILVTHEFKLIDVQKAFEVALAKANTKAIKVLVSVKPE